MLGMVLYLKRMQYVVTDYLTLIAICCIMHVTVMCVWQFKVAIVVMGRPKYLPDDGDHVINLDDFQPPHWQGRARSFDGTWFNLIVVIICII